MSAPSGDAEKTLLPQAELEREARRILRRLCISRSFLLRLPDGDFAVARSRETAPASRVRISGRFIAGFTARGWLMADGPGRFVASEAGRGWLARSLANEDEFAAQHRLIETRTILAPDGREQAARFNAAESALSRLRFRGLIEPAAFEAGERLRRDFTLAQLTPRLGVDWDAPVRGGVRGARGEDLSDTVIAAKQRVGRALAAVGPGLSDLLFDICCHLVTLEAAEIQRGWSRRSGRVVLKIALDRLAAHYGMGAPARAGIRAWKAQAPMEEASA